jgi:hypothetical protein
VNKNAGRRPGAKRLTGGGARCTVEIDTATVFHERKSMKYQPLLETYLAGVYDLNGVMGLIPEKDLNVRPARENAWTIKEHVIHLVDSEVNGFIRAKSIIAQPNATAFVMEEEGWTKNLARKNEDLKKYLLLFGVVRSLVVDLFQDEPEENWTKDGYLRTYKGETKKVTLEKYFEMYISHVAFHLEYINKVKNEIDNNTAGRT